MNIIDCSDLVKEYEIEKKKPGLKGAVEGLFKRDVSVKIAVKDLNLQVKEGEFIGVIGPNGAGKTTMMKMLTGIIRPTSGTINVLGYDPGKLQKEFKNQFALVMGQKSQLWWDLPAIDSFILNKEIYRIPDKEYKERLDFFIEQFNLQDIVNVQVRKLSLGERMKLELVASLLHKPKILFLDEPTIGLDVIAQEAIHDFLKKVNQEMNVTILLTSHYMQEIRELCNRVVLINKGTKVYDGYLSDIIAQYTEMKKIDILFSKNVDWNTLDLNLEDFYYEVGENNRVSFLVERERIGTLLQMILDRADVLDITIQEEELSSVIQKIYKETAK